MLTLALGVFAQSKGKNAMTLRLVDIKVTDGTLVNIAKEPVSYTHLDVYKRQGSGYRACEPYVLMLAG